MEITAFVLLFLLLTSALIYAIVQRSKVYDFDSSVTIPCISGDLNNNVYNILLLKQSIVFLGDYDKEELKIDLSKIKDVKLIHNKLSSIDVKPDRYINPGYLVINYNNENDCKELIFDATTAKFETENMITKIKGRVK